MEGFDVDGADASEVLGYEGDGDNDNGDNDGNDSDDDDMTAEHPAHVWDTFCDSTDVSKMFLLCCNLRYKLYFALFCCDFLTNCLTHWLRTQTYYSNPSVFWKIVSTHSSVSATCV